MKVRLYLDEDALTSDFLVALRARNLDVTTASEAQMRGRSDEEQLRYATEQGRVIYTFNVKHYMALHTKYLEQGSSHEGIILVTNQHWSVGEQMRRTANLIQHLSAEEMKDKVEYLSSWR